MGVRRPLSCAASGQSTGASAVSPSASATWIQPGRDRYAFPQRLVTRETPATAPKPCGRSPGRHEGARSGRAPAFRLSKKSPESELIPGRHKPRPVRRATRLPWMSSAPRPGGWTAAYLWRCCWAARQYATIMVSRWPPPRCSFRCGIRAFTPRLLASPDRSELHKRSSSPRPQFPMSSGRHLRNSPYQTPFPRHLLTSLTTIDSHVHPLNPTRFRKPRLDGDAVLRRAFGIDEFNAGVIRLGFASIVYVQVDATPDEWRSDCRARSATVEWAKLVVVAAVAVGSITTGVSRQLRNCCR